MVENKAGAGGLIGSREVAKAAPDGRTLVVSGIGSHVIAPVESPNSFDLMSDFSHIALLAGPPLGFVVNAEQPIKDVKGFIAHVQANPKGLSWGYPGLTGTTWFSLSGPAGMPSSLVAKINAEVRRGLQTPAVAKALLAESMETADLDAAAFTAFVASEIARWTPAVKSLTASPK